MLIACSLVVCDENGTLPLSSSQNTQPLPNHEEDTRQTQTEGYSIKYLTSTTQNYQGHQKRGKSVKWSQP